MHSSVRPSPLTPLTPHPSPLTPHKLAQAHICLAASIRPLTQCAMVRFKSAFIRNITNAWCTGMWNEIDELIYNTTNGPVYGTSLFISKSNTQISSSVGYGTYASAGLFSNHDSTGTCGASACTAAQATAGTCPSAPLAWPYDDAPAIAGGMPASVAGGQGVCSRTALSRFIISHRYPPVSGIHADHGVDIYQLQTRVDAQLAGLDD